MSETFVVCNQLGQFWGKKHRWVDGHVAQRVMRLKHQDEALNLLVELSAKDVDLRGEVLGVELDRKGFPLIEPSEHRLEDEDDIAPEAENEDGEGDAVPQDEDENGDDTAPQDEASDEAANDDQPPASEASP